MPDGDEKGLHERVHDFTIRIVRYFETLYSILLHPHKTFENYRSDVLTKPGTFLVINIVLSYSIGELIGYRSPSFPFGIELLTRMQNWTGNYFFVIVRFVLGFLIFLLLLKYFLRYKYENFQHFTSMVFPVFCYSSAVYLPFILIKHYSNVYLSNVMLNMLTADRMPLKVDLLTFLNYPAYLFIRIILVFWWLWLFCTAIKFLVTRARVKRAVIFAFLFFVSFQLLIVSVSFITLNWSLIRNSLIITLDEMGSGPQYMTPPNYFKALYLASDISDNKVWPFPEYVRYVYKLKKMTYIIASYRTNDSLTVEALKNLRERNYDYLQKILDEDISKWSSKDDSKKAIYHMLTEDLKDAEQLRKSPNFIDLHGKPIHIIFGAFYFIPNQLQEPIYSTDLRKDTVNIQCPVPPSLISLFP